MRSTTVGMIFLLIIIVYFLILSLKLIFIGMGKIENPNTKKIDKNGKFILRGSIGLVVTTPFLCYISFIFIQVFLI